MASQSKLSVTRVIVSLFVGAFIGAAIFCTQYLIQLYEINGVEHFTEFAVSKGIKIFIPAYIVWLIALAYWVVRYGHYYTLRNEQIGFTQYQQAS